MSDALFAARLHIEKGTLLSDAAVQAICIELLLRASRDESDRRGLGEVESIARAEDVLRPAPHATSMGEALAAELKKQVVCLTCNDTHRMHLTGLGRDVPCTACPMPCGSCRMMHPSGGAYCATIPCNCDCHTAPAVWRGE